MLETHRTKMQDRLNIVQIKINEEMNRLNINREKLTTAVKDGDIKESGDVEIGRNLVSMSEKQLHEISVIRNSIISFLKIIDIDNPSKIRVGVSVTLHNLTTNVLYSFCVVPSILGDVENGFLSVKSPIGSLLVDLSKESIFEFANNSWKIIDIF